MAENKSQNRRKSLETGNSSFAIKSCKTSKNGEKNIVAIVSQRVFTVIKDLTTSLTKDHSMFQEILPTWAAGNNATCIFFVVVVGRCIYCQERPLGHLLYRL